MKVLLTGASGFIGRNVAQALVVQGHTVQPVSRRHGLDMGRLLQPADWLPLLDGVDAVVNAAGIICQTRQQRFEQLHTQAPVALFQACARRGAFAVAPRVVQLSALGADSTACTAFHRSKHAADQALLALPLAATVLRPSLVYGRGGTSATWLMRLARLPWLPVPDLGPSRIQPVHVSDVVAAVLQALARPAGPAPLDVVGRQAFTLAGWLQVLRAAQGLPPARLLRVPGPVALVLGRVLQPLLPLAAPDNLRMLARSRAVDGGPLQRLLGRAPLPPSAGLLGADASILWTRP